MPSVGAASSYTPSGVWPMSRSQRPFLQCTNVYALPILVAAAPFSHGWWGVVHGVEKKEAWGVPWKSCGRRRTMAGSRKRSRPQPRTLRKAPYCLPAALPLESLCVRGRRKSVKRGLCVQNLHSHLVFVDCFTHRHRPLQPSHCFSSLVSLSTPTPPSLRLTLPSPRPRHPHRLVC